MAATATVACVAPLSAGTVYERGDLALKRGGPWTPSNVYDARKRRILPRHRATDVRRSTRALRCPRTRPLVGSGMRFVDSLRTYWVEIPWRAKLASLRAPSTGTGDCGGQLASVGLAMRCIDRGALTSWSGRTSGTSGIKGAGRSHMFPKRGARLFYGVVRLHPA